MNPLSPSITSKLPSSFIFCPQREAARRIDTIGKKAVLILGRFTDERKAVLEAIREELRQRDYIPILFDFAKPASRDLTETVGLWHICHAS